MKLFIFSFFALMPLLGFTQSEDLADVPLTLYAPNCFTPNNDGLNDGWGIDTDQEWDQVQISVYDTWGNLVWQTESIEGRWVGNYDSGDYFSPGDQYFYTITVKMGTETVEKRGVINMIR